MLHHWLSHAPNYDEVTRWYLGWKGLFPQDLLDTPQIRANFNHALNLMNSAADGQPLPAFVPPVAGYGAAASAAAAATAATAPGVNSGAVYGSGVEPSLKELVARYATDTGVDFLPKVGRYYDGLQVYSFGGVSCVLEPSSSVIRAQVRDRWAPVSLERLRQEALNKAAGG